MTRATAQLTRSEQDRESLERGQRWKPNGNDVACILAFTSRGIPAEQVETYGPNQNVFTYKAWRAKGRQVRKGEKSVRLTVWRPLVPLTDLIATRPLPIDPATGEPVKAKYRPCIACVFHVSQTDAVEGGAE